MTTHARSDSRRRQILEHARFNGHVEVTAIAGELDVTVETIRRDLKVLEGNGLLRRTHGGAYPVEADQHPSASDLRRKQAAQQRIARAAINELGKASTVFIDQGDTSRMLAEAIAAERMSLTVVTSSLTTAGILACHNQIAVILLGGRVRAEPLATFDHWTTAMLADLALDVAFIGASGVSATRGATTVDAAAAAVKAQVVAVSKRRVLLATHEKFDTTAFSRFANIADFDVIITDDAFNAAAVDTYSHFGPRFIRA